MRTAAAEKEKVNLCPYLYLAESTGGKIEELEKALAEKDGMIAEMRTAAAEKEKEISSISLYRQNLQEAK